MFAVWQKAFKDSQSWGLDLRNLYSLEAWGFGGSEWAAAMASEAAADMVGEVEVGSRVEVAEARADAEEGDEAGLPKDDIAAGGRCRGWNNISLSLWNVSPIFIFKVCSWSVFDVKISGKFVNSSHVVLVDDWQCQDNRDEFSTLDLLIPTSHLSHYFCDGFLTFLFLGRVRTAKGSAERPLKRRAELQASARWICDWLLKSRSHHNTRPHNKHVIWGTKLVVVKITQKRHTDTFSWHHSS